MRVTNYTLVKCARSLPFAKDVLCVQNCVFGFVFALAFLIYLVDGCECLNRRHLQLITMLTHRCHFHLIVFIFRFILYVIWLLLFVFFFLSFSRTNRYNISWTVDSHTPIEEFKLYFRRLPQGHDIDNSIDQQQQQPLQHTHRDTQSHRNYGNLMHWSRNDWRDVVLPSVPLSHHYTQGMSYMIRGLDPDQQYEARVQARYIFFFKNIFHHFPILHLQFHSI